MSRIHDDLRSCFDLASLRHAASKQLTPKEWERFREIREAHDQQRRFVRRSFEIERPELLARATKRILAEEGKCRRDLKPPWAVSHKPGKAEIKRRAANRVQAHEQAELSHVDRAEAKDLRELLDGCEARQRLRDKPKQEFARAAERRSGRDRRQHER